MIPKKIHYVWLGRKDKPKSFELSISAVNKHAKGYEVKIWTEDHLQEFKLPKYFYNAYSSKKWAFASDVYRLFILQRYGGIYLDSDQILIKNIGDIFLDYNLFTATFHEVSDYYGFQMIGSVPNFFVINKMIDFYISYESDKFIIINKVFSDIVKTFGTEDFSKIKIFSQDYFYPLTKNHYTKNTYAYHMGDTSWIPFYKKILFKIPYYLQIRNTVKRILPEFVKNFLFKVHYLIFVVGGGHSLF